MRMLINTIKRWVCGGARKQTSELAASVEAVDPHLEIRPVEITTPDGIICRYGILSDAADSSLPSILVVEFAGVYPYGSSGNAHGHFIVHSTIRGLAAFDPWCLILDLRELKYEWGNALLSVFNEIDNYMNDDDDDPRFPFAVVTSQKCRAAFLALVTPMGAPPPDWHFDDFEIALKQAIEWANEWIDT